MRGMCKQIVAVIHGPRTTIAELDGAASIIGIVVNTEEVLTLEEVNIGQGVLAQPGAARHPTDLLSDLRACHPEPDITSPLMRNNRHHTRAYCPLLHRYSPICWIA